jgi:predicted deacetylase
MSRDFVAWCRRDRAFEVEWLLHGYTHADEAPASVALSPKDRFKRRFLTASEGEFLPLEAIDQQRRIQDGLAVFRQCLQRDPTGFVAPAWLFNRHLFPILRDNGIQYTEDHSRLFSVTTGKSLLSPVITWATRTSLRKYGSVIAAPLLARHWHNEDILRVAMHPFDFDHPETVNSVRENLARLMSERETLFTRQLDFGNAL